MSGFEDIETDRAFTAMMADNSFATDSTASFGLELVVQDYQRVGLDREVGEELHMLLAGAQDDAEMAMAGFGITLADNLAVSDMVLTALTMAAVHCKLGETFERQFAVDGFGLFGVQETGESRYLDYEILSPGERLFGRLGGVAFGAYHTIDEAEIRGLQSAEHLPTTPPPAPGIGGLIRVKDVLICDGDEERCGVVDRSFETVFIPVKVDTFRWARVFKL